MALFINHIVSEALSQSEGELVASILKFILYDIGYITTF